MVKNHVFGDPNFKTVEILIFKATLSKTDIADNLHHELHQVKVLLSVERGVSHDFDFSDEFQPFGIPFIYFLH